MVQDLTPDFDAASAIRRVDAADWERFAAYRLAGMRRNAVAEAVIAEMESWQKDKWQADLLHPEKAFFAAVVNGEYVGHGCVFKTKLDSQPCREIVLEVSEDHANRGFGRLLYEAMKTYAQTHYPDDAVIARIIPDNTRSIRAASHAGFLHADDVVSDGVLYGIYTPA